MEKELAKVHAQVTVVRAPLMMAKTLFRQISKKVSRLLVVNRR